jgi:predicted PurR-regulated permease PerM
MKEKYYSYAVLALVLVLGYLSYLILRSYLVPIGWAIVFAIVFYPICRFFVRFIKWQSLAAAITTILVCVLILGPLSYFTVLLKSEISTISFQPVSIKGWAKLLNHPSVAPTIKKVLPLFNTNQTQLQAKVVEGVSEIGKKLLENIPGYLGDMAGAAVHFALMAFALFFFLRDGPIFLARIGDLIPFSVKHKQKLMNQVKDTVISTIYGGIVVAIAQGLIGGTAFALLSIHSPVLWGLAISISSFIPIVGATIVWIPTVIILLIKGFVGHAIILALIGIFLISMVDNVLRPLIMRGRMRMPLLVIFLSVLGGIEVFGLIGLVMGPLVLAIFISVIDILRDVEGEYE